MASSLEYLLEESLAAIGKGVWARTRTAVSYEGAADRRREVPIDEIPYDEPAASISPAEAACTVQELWGSGLEMNLSSFLGQRGTCCLASRISPA